MFNLPEVTLIKTFSHPLVDNKLGRPTFVSEERKAQLIAKHEQLSDSGWFEHSTVVLKWNGLQGAFPLPNVIL